MEVNRHFDVQWIRQLLQTHLFHQQLSAPQSPWTTSSYVWGAPIPTSTIVCNGRPFEVTENLYGALLQFRTLEVGTDPEAFKCFWINVICINQGNNAKKSTQVPLMASIYRVVTNVTMWLGPSSRDSSFAMTAWN
ncbi:heterokaryon incompatibility protein-domain-containing protein [Hypoxylon sp. FL1150]|nr:heterokaryon incompatibility protein-domain-containing protein [Hypoxylon sp. FL1150]